MAAIAFIDETGFEFPGKLWLKPSRAPEASDWKPLIKYRRHILWTFMKCPFWGFPRTNSLNLPRTLYLNRYHWWLSSPQASPRHSPLRQHHLYYQFWLNVQFPNSMFGNLNRQIGPDDLIWLDLPRWLRLLAYCLRGGIKGEVTTASLRAYNKIRSLNGRRLFIVIFSSRRESCERPSPNAEFCKSGLLSLNGEMIN